MKRKILYKIASIAMICLMLMSIYITAFALEAKPDSSQKGSINISMRSKGSAVPGGEITLFYVAKLKANENGNYSYVFTPDFEPSEISISNLNDKSLPQKLQDYAQANKLKGMTKKIDENGKVSFNDLEPGLYLAVETKASEGFYLAPSFIFEIPHYNSDKGQWEYNIEAVPKVEKQPKPDETTIPQPTTTPAETLPSKPAGPELPHTGQLNWPIPVLAFAGILLFIIGWSMYYKKGNK